MTPALQRDRRAAKNLRSPACVHKFRRRQFPSRCWSGILLWVGCLSFQHLGASSKLIFGRGFSPPPTVTFLVRVRGRQNGSSIYGGQRNSKLYWGDSKKRRISLVYPFGFLPVGVEVLGPGSFLAVTSSSRGLELELVQDYSSNSEIESKLPRRKAKSVISK